MAAVCLCLEKLEKKNVDFSTELIVPCGRIGTRVSFLKETVPQPSLILVLEICW